MYKTARYHWTSNGHHFYVTFNSKPEYTSEHCEITDIPSGRAWVFFDPWLIATIRQDAIEII